MAGILAARVLAETYERVTVVERDRFHADADHRRGVPQGHHFHTLLLRGTRLLDTLFPGLSDELVEAGAVRTNLLGQARVVLAGHELCRVTTGHTIQLTRPLLDRHVRARLAAVPNVKLLDGCEVGGLRTTGDRVTGVRVAHRTGRVVAETITADLVVDAMGRAGRTASWLPGLGFDAPPQERIKADIAYVSRLVRFPEHARPADQLVLVGAVPGRPRGFILGRQEDDRWMLTVVGMAGDHPPTDDAGLLDFVATAAPADVMASIRAAEPVEEPSTHRFPASVWRHYERLRRFPAGLLAFGDSICSFNPVYGQGMTVAALEADALRRCLADGEQDLARRFHRAAARIVAPAWQLNAGGDLALPEIEGHRPLSVRLVNRYVARLQRIAEHDPVVAATFLRVAGLLAPPSSMMAPRILARALTRR
ncbi:2-polyprenyl-6-methoxyphenol hydroxylase-like FAD-dependent oxidoreductase [Actinophytocola oryzae]|uniref:2-polyprenyl-6-methoxyphenol hydroxylase-like FAD-dependent oxidoreductase n=2 Tax=Actinophytocola oryzae TaxID=502181 RepID=A0A4R7UY20_9PSEU|nr:2-polyprenyl-6-methoxyphenol hydroxylase-like FAD-dependent oxidoreductase [Actinophytocola oryzae]